MSFERELNKRSGSKCELCAATENLKEYQVLPTKKGGIEESVLACKTCIDQIETPGNEDLNQIEVAITYSALGVLQNLNINLNNTQ